MWDKVIEKAIDAKAKTSLQALFGTKTINFRCPKDYKPSVKKNNKHDAHREHRNGDKDKAKSHNPFSANSQP